MDKQKRPNMAISSNRPKSPIFYSRLNRIGERHFTTWSEEWRICLLCDAGGYSYKTIARWVYGNGDSRYIPSRTEINRVGRVLKSNKRKVQEWRNCDTKESKSFAGTLMNRPIKSGQPKLKIA